MGYENSINYNLLYSTNVKDRGGILAKSEGQIRAKKQQTLTEESQSIELNLNPL